MTSHGGMQHTSTCCDGARKKAFSQATQFFHTVQPFAAGACFTFTLHPIVTESRLTRDPVLTLIVTLMWVLYQIQ